MTYIKTRALIIFISGHGYGHVSRMSHVINVLYKSLKHNEKLIIITQADSKFILQRESKNVIIIKQQHDIGLIQQDSFNIDIDSTINKLAWLQDNLRDIIETILKQINQFEISLILSDISPLAFELAKILNIPSFFVGNFTWTDIYQDLGDMDSRFLEFIPLMNQQYQYAKKCFSLPMHTQMQPFTHDKMIKLPFIAPPESSMTIEEWEQLTLQKYGAKKVILLSFGGFDFNDLPTAYLKKISDKYLFITTRAMGRTASSNMITIDSMCLDYSGLIKFADLVITKPGYGIITDCLRHSKPILYTDRGRFAEYKILKNWLDKNYPSKYISNQMLLSGKVGDTIEDLLNQNFEFNYFDLSGADKLSKYLLREIS